MLRVAERRMLTGAEPGPVEAAPVPLARSVFRRVLKRRVMVWLSLTAAIALVIVISERRQGVGPGVQLARRADETPAAANNRVMREPEPPPTIRAVHDRENEPSKEAVTKVLGDRAAKSPAGAPAPAASPPASALQAPTPAEKPTAPASSATKTETVPTKRGLVAGEASGAFGGGKKIAVVNHGATSHETYVNNAGQAGQPEQADKSGIARGPVLVVRCDINPQAAKRRPLEKLLDANGMTWRMPRDLDRLTEETGNLSRAVVQSPAAGPQAGVGVGSDEKAAEDARRRAGGQTWQRSSAEASGS